MTRTGGSTGPRLRVLQSFGPPRRTTNPYLVQLVDALSGEVDVLPFSWATALLGRYDVVHLHWPETLLRASTRPRTLARRVRFALVLARLAASRTGVVRTLHNTAPHEAPSATERLLLRWCERRTDVWIRLNPVSAPPTGAPVVTVLHGHYRDWFKDRPRPAVEPGRVLFFGLVRPYKGVEQLVSAFTALPEPGASLRIVGKPTSDELAQAMASSAAADPRISTRLEYVDDDVLADEVGRAALVVLPYREMHNSGAALLALSLDRPVLLPAGPVVERLREEVGSAWVTTFDGELGPDDLERALHAARQVGGRPDLRARDWADTADLHLRAYRTAVAARRTRRRGGVR